ncbi:uroporphyrinogen-III synthase [Loigolactobacillus binensis]|uniref:Uroporphyrinogen-III synthase n=1 Tax=Loigolactobacillus binensis TaxID=2559922 RepID=A0ABW3EDS2_9LACO|nr:uroporphyrinogen-III synthase [Loigolactobacillus binensis]
MAILITYPQAKIPLIWQQRLAAQLPVIYYPFRELIFCPLTGQAQMALRQADYVVLTSGYAAACLVAHYAELVRQATLVVLSAKIGQQVNGCGKAVLIAPQPQQQALIAYLAQIRRPQQRVIALVGNLTRLSGGVNWKLLPIYRNQWSTTAAAEAQTKLAGLSIQQALITSPSNFCRFWQVYRQPQLPHFVALGTTTAQVIRQQGLVVQVPPPQPQPQPHLLTAALTLLNQNLAENKPTFFDK